ncbi:MAG TPA: acyl carrier protein [Pirellulales bacterium]|jgi:acyl carrier protein|nr:acyl carrier protein [Pirellulales bacterium]
MVINPRSLGLERTANVIRQLVVDQAGPGWDLDKICADEPVISAGMGMSSLEAVEFLVELEKKFGVPLNDLHWWTYDSPTIRQVAQHLIDLAD